jgi:hypothetical protein
MAKPNGIAFVAPVFRPAGAAVAVVLSSGRGQEAGGYYILPTTIQPESESKNQQQRANPNGGDSAMPAAKKVLRALLVVATILLLAAILIPAYLRSKIADGGDPAANTLRVIVSANETYDSTYSNGFARTLSQLAGFPTTKGNCDHAALIDDALASGRKYEYVYTYTAKPSTNPPAKGCSQAGASAFSVSADPVTPSAEHRYYFIDETGVLRVEKNKPASASSPPIE